jgi:hypothetical protein
MALNLVNFPIGTRSASCARSRGGAEKVAGGREPAGGPADDGAEYGLAVPGRPPGADPRQLRGQAG